MLGLIEDPEGVGRLLDFSTELLWGLYERLLDHPDIPGLNISEPEASGDLISPGMFSEFVAPHLNELVSKARDRGKVSSLHICGDTTKILDQVLTIAPDCFSLEAKTKLARAKEVLGGRVCVVGNVSPTGVFYSRTPQEVVAEGRQYLQERGEPSGFILSVGCDFPKDVPLDNIKALMSFKGDQGSVQALTTSRSQRSSQ